MKKPNLFISIIVMASVFFSCSKEEIENAENALKKSIKSTESVVVPDILCEGQPLVLDLIAGQNMDAGNVTIEKDDDSIYVTFETYGGCLEEVHVYIGDISNVPDNKKNTPIPGQFPYSAENINESTFTLEIPVNEITSCGIILAHAQLCNGETAWCRGNDKYFTLKLWYGFTVNGTYYKGWSVIKTEDQFYTGDGSWPCEVMGVVKLTDDIELKLMAGDEDLQIGTAEIDIEGDDIVVNILLNSGYSVDESYAFYGTLQDLLSFGDCPNYRTFPYPIPGDDQASFMIPFGLSSSYTFEEFGSPRWGFLGYYCICTE